MVDMNKAKALFVGFFSTLLHKTQLPALTQRTVKCKQKKKNWNRGWEGWENLHGNQAAHPRKNAIQCSPEHGEFAIKTTEVTTCLSSNTGPFTFCTVHPPAK